MRYLLIAFLLFSLNGFGQFAQLDKRYNSFSVELGAGIHAPIAPTKGIQRSKYIALRQFEISGRYMFDQTFGLKAHYSFNGFQNPDAKEMTLNYHRIGIEGVANLSNLLNVNYPLREHFGILFHTGVGITFADPYSTKGTDHLGHIIMGVKPQVKLSEKFSVYGDVSWVVNFKQHYDYNGRLMNSNYDAENGFFMNLSVGVIMNLGSKKYHADWY